MGEWEAPEVKNPACQSAPGCGEWKRPMKDNPDYKGKWIHPMIDNPDYVGEWKPAHNPHLYTAVLRRDQTFEIYIDSESVASGKIKEEMNAFVDGKQKDYGFVPPKEIDDPSDKKPEDWVDEAKIKDPEASKPDDWDEDAPKQILDMDVETPDGWLEDAPE